MQNCLSEHQQWKVERGREAGKTGKFLPGFAQEGTSTYTSILEIDPEEEVQQYGLSRSKCL